MVTMIRQTTINPAHHPNRQLANIFRSMYQEIQLQLSYLSPCYVSGIRHTIQVPKENEIQVCLTACATGNFVDANGDDLEDNDIPFGEQFEADENNLALLTPANVSPLPGGGQTPISGFGISIGASATGVAKMLRKNLRNLRKNSKDNFDGSAASLDSSAVNNTSLEFDTRDNSVGALLEAFEMKADGSESSVLEANRTISTTSRHFVPNDPSTAILEASTRPLTHITLSPNHTLPEGSKVERFLGRVSLHFVKENSLIFEQGSGLFGMGGFTHSVISELHAILRYIEALILQ